MDGSCCVESGRYAESVPAYNQMEFPLLHAVVLVTSAFMRKIFNIFVVSFFKTIYLFSGEI